ncbi:MAG: Maf family protein [Spirochaetaceae bacterium]
MTERITLASRSPRRTELLERLGILHDTLPADIDEEAVGGAPPVMAQRLAERKALAVADRSSTRLVLGADTVVAMGTEALGKPRDRADARRMIESLAGRDHEVHTAVAILENTTGAILSDVSTTTVHFAPMSEAEIDWYLATDEWQDVAGGYRIQGLGGCFIPRIDGSYTGVMGLPIDSVYSMLCRYHFTWTGSEPM